MLHGSGAADLITRRNSTKGLIIHQTYSPFLPIHHSVLRPLLWVANVPCKFLLSAAIFIWLYRFKPVESLRSSTHVRLGLPLPRLPASLPSIVSGAGMIFQQGGQDQPFPAGGLGAL